MGRSGIEGRVIIGPIRPPVSPAQRQGEPDYGPYRATFSVTDQRGRTVTRFRSDADGRFRVPLEPGIYTLRPESTVSYPRVEEQEVTVSEDQYTEVLISYDSGIR